MHNQIGANQLARDFEKFLKANPDISGRIGEVAQERGVKRVA